MALLGCGFLALWNDVDPARETEYERWHAEEHVPERVSIPGMLAARRFKGATNGGQRFLTLYEAASPDIFASAPYLAVAEKPTPWSLSMRPSLRDFHRVPCVTLRTTGRGLQAHALALRFVIPPGIEVPEVPAALESVAVHLGRADARAGFPIANAGPADTAGVEHVVLAEAGFADELEALEELITTWLTGAGGLRCGRYALISALRHEEVDPTLWQTGRTVS